MPLIYQIFSRTDGSPDPNTRVGNDFQTVLQNLICKICIDHPYHGLIQLIALKNGNNVGGGRDANTYLENVGDKKVATIEQLIRRIQDMGPAHVAELLNSYESLANAYIALAMEPTKPFTDRKKTKNVPFTQIRSNGKPLLTTCLKGRSLFLPCVLTKPPQIRPAADYGDGSGTDPVGSERILSFNSKFSLTDTGLHRPKIVVCQGTQGGLYKQLVKGEGAWYIETASNMPLFQPANVIAHTRL